MEIFGVNLQQFFSNPVNVLLVAVAVYAAWHFYKTYEGFSDDKPVILLFHLPTCGYCKDMMPEWDKFQKAHENDPNVQVVKVNGAENQKLTEEHGVTGFPTVIKIKDGQKEVFDGERTAQALEGFLNA